MTHCFRSDSDTLTLGGLNEHALKNGQVKLELSHHEHDSEGNFKSVKALVFVLDQLPDDQSMTKKEKKKNKQSAPTARNFGAFLSIPALKDAENLCLAWRCRSLFMTWDLCCDPFRSFTLELRRR